MLHLTARACRKVRVVSSPSALLPVLLATSLERRVPRPHSDMVLV